MTERRQIQYCPRCAGAGAIIAVWPYINRDMLTQGIGATQVPNALEASVVVYGVGAPSSNMPMPPTPRFQR
eukprot:9278059-Lingulodinium_polyedra.AAC.1